MKTDAEELHCIGCGALIQTTTPKQSGYTPASALEKAMANGAVYCQRCFRLRHYNEVADVELTDKDFIRILQHIGATNALIVNVVDIFDFNGSLIPGLHRFTGKNPVILVGNKEDLLPKSLHRSRIQDWLRQQANRVGLHPEQVVLTSATKNHAVDELLAVIEKYRDGRDVYVVGTTNVGKSTLINQIIKQATGMADVITTSRFPGTTLDQIEIPLDDGHFLIDTPGIIHREQMAHYLTGKELRYALPQREIKPKTYQLNPEQTLFLGALARFDYVAGPRTGVTLYLENNLKVHRTKLVNATQFYQRHAGELLQPPFPQNIKNYPPLVRTEFKVTTKSDLVFAGLGWVTVRPGTVVAGWAPKGMAVTLRRAMI